MAFLSLECERLGYSAIGEQLLKLYVNLCEDPISPELLQFYRSFRALVRALLSAWHLEDELPQEQAAHWVERASWYIHTAQASIDDAL